MGAPRKIDPNAPECECHGEPMLWLKYRDGRKGGGMWRCRVKQAEYGEAKYRRFKERLARAREERGDKCERCGQPNVELTKDERTKQFLDWHHTEKKNFQVTMMCVGEARLAEELEKCLLLCPNCHRLADFE